MKSSACYYFDDITKIVDFDCAILLDEKSHKNIFVYDMSYKTLISVKNLRIRFDGTDGFIRVYDGTRYLVLFGGEKVLIIMQKSKLTHMTLCPWKKH